MGDSEKAGGGVRIAWVKLGKVWWPGKRLSEGELTEQMKSELESLLSRKKNVKPEEVHVVKFLNEDAYEIAHNPIHVLVDVDEDKKLDMVKRAVSSMKSSTLAENKSKFKADVLQAERLLNPSADLSDLTKILDGETLEKKPVGAAKYADIFPSAKSEKASPTGISPLKGKAGAIKFNFPSSRIINKASSKSPSKISPLPSDPSKKYKCAKCAFSVDRVNVITAHMRYCNATPSPQKRATSAPSPQPKKVTSTPSTVATPPVMVPSPKKVSPALTPAATPTTSTTPARRPGRPPRKSIAPATPVAATSPPKISPAVEPAAVVPKKRGRKSKKDKQMVEKQKAEILQDWNDSSSEENDSDDELAPMLPPTKPPELFLFGSEKNKKRKADAVADEKVDAVATDGEVKATVANEDEPPVLKKPRTDKELSDAFDSLLKTTKMELPEWDGKDGKKETDEEMEVDEHQLSDIEEDANIVMKKGDALEDTEVASDVMKVDEEDVKNASAPGKKSPEKKRKAEKSKAKTPEPVEPVKAPVPATPTTRKIEADKKKETSSKKAEEKKVEAMPTRKSMRTRGGMIAKEPDTKPIEQEKQSVTLEVIAKPTVTPTPPASPKKKTEEVPVVVTKESPKKVPSAHKDDKKVEPESTPSKETKKEVEKEKKTTTETEKSKPPQRASSPRKKELKEEKVEEVSKPEPKKVEAIPEPKKLSPLVPVSTEASTPPTVVEDKKEKDINRKEAKKEEKQEAKKDDKKEEKKVDKKDEKIEEKKEVKKDEKKEDKKEVKKDEKKEDKKEVKKDEKKEDKKEVKKDEKKEEIKDVKQDKKAESVVPPPEPVQDVKKTEAKKSTPQSPTKAVSQPVPTPIQASVTPASPTKAKTATVATVKATAASPPIPKAAPTTVTSVAKPVVETSAPVPPPPIVNATKSAPKPVPQKKAEEKKPVATATPPVSAVKVPPPPIVSPTKVSTPTQPPQKKPTAAVRPLVDTKEVPTVKDGGKGVPTTVTVTPPKGSPRDQAQATAGQTPGTQQQQQQQGDGDESGKKSPALVAQRVVHLVPVENQDGTITYMLLSLENGDNQNVVLEQGGEASNTVLRVDKVEPSDQSAPITLPMNPNEVEGIFLDKNVENANQIVSALAQATQSMTQTTATATSVMDGTTAYVTLAMDAMDGGLGIAASGSEAVATSGVGVVQPSILVQEGVAGAQDGSGESQQVFYMTEDGSFLDPSSLGLTFEQLQQLLNQT